MDNNKQIKIDVEAERTALSSLVETAQAMDSEIHQEKTKGAEQAFANDPSTQTKPLEVSAVPNETPASAKKNVLNGPSTVEIEKELNNLKESLNSGLMPYLQGKFDSISDQLPRKDGDSILEQRITQAEINFVFQERLTGITKNPIWA